MRSRRTLLILSTLATAALIAAGCGGDSDDSSASTPAAESATSASADAGTDDTSSDDAESANEAESTDDAAEESAAPASAGATVTIDGETFTAVTEVICLTIGGAVSGSWTDGGEISIDIDMPPNDNDDPSWVATIRVDDDNDPTRQFRADAEFVGTLNIANPELSMVSSYAIDGSSVSGSASFYEINAALTGADTPLLEGTFSAACA